MKILIIIPVYHREEISLNCVMSLIGTTFIPVGLDVSVSIGINYASDDLKNSLNEIVEKRQTKNLSIKVTDFGKNLGKPKTVNILSKDEKFDYLVSLDGDMICTQPNWLINMLGVYGEYKRNPSIRASINHVPFSVPIGALCSNQFGYNCHVLTETSPKAIVRPIGTFTLITSMDPGGVAGGILMTERATWEMIGGYDGNTIYGGDDGYYAGQCYSRKMVVGYIKEIGFYHPYELNKEYQDWKVRAVQMITKAGPGLTQEEMGGYF